MADINVTKPKWAKEMEKESKEEIDRDRLIDRQKEKSVIKKEREIGGKVVKRGERQSESERDRERQKDRERDRQTDRVRHTNRKRKV